MTQLWKQGGEPESSRGVRGRYGVLCAEGGVHDLLMGNGVSEEQGCRNPGPELAFRLLSKMAGRAGLLGKPKSGAVQMDMGRGPLGCEACWSRAGSTQ